MIHITHKILTMILLIMILSISGEQIGYTDTFAYLSFRDGRIVPYRVVNGVFIPVTGDCGKVDLA